MRAPVILMAVSLMLTGLRLMPMRRRQRVLELLRVNQGFQALTIAARVRCSLATAKREMAALVWKSTMQPALSRSGIFAASRSASPSYAVQEIPAAFSGRNPTGRPGGAGWGAKRRCSHDLGY